MDVRELIEDLKGDLTCSICLGYFADPVTVKCGHSFCTECLLRCREETNETLTCPECRGVIKYSDLVPNRSLQDLSITAKMLRPHLLQSMVGLTTCDQHGEKEKFFCEEDQRLLCDSCLLAPEHKGHQVLPWETAADKHKEKLQETLTVLRRKEEEFKMVKNVVKRRKTYCKESTYNLKQSVASEYRKMHQFLWDEEYEYLQRFEQQLRDNLDKLEEKKAKLSQQIHNLQRLTLKVVENLDKLPSEMFQDTQGTLEKNEELLLQKPEIAVPVLNIYSITGLREMIMSFQRDITLDPESANPHLILSADLKSVQYRSVPQDLPDNKERFDSALAVLGAQTFTSGKHYWEVEMEDKTEWQVGICKDSVNRKGELSSSSEDMRILAGYTSENNFYLRYSKNDFQTSQALLNLGIFLDYERGHIAFYDVTARSLIYSPSDMEFEGPFRPFFSFGIHDKDNNFAGSLTICPISNQ
ncbi:probable E3 ubiquitin-protein ligase TRIML1 [Dromiciops gliroides]|uniref:probable E3 ubiquitin-protein ligase TRIML1 n=1 Tax=Dromiciops gliroides TaxID=33562 RepID=UPI001CC733D7|nr:probable E3 ubiquitin-protein ligase TRIML1 [Dromiciops gliroides]